MTLLRCISVRIDCPTRKVGVIHFHHHFHSRHPIKQPPQSFAFVVYIAFGLWSIVNGAIVVGGLIFIPILCLSYSSYLVIGHRIS